VSHYRELAEVLTQLPLALSSRAATPWSIATEGSEGDWHAVHDVGQMGERSTITYWDNDKAAGMAGPAVIGLALFLGEGIEA
jgi:hypothetical protein